MVGTTGGWGDCCARSADATISGVSDAWGGAASIAAGSACGGVDGGNGGGDGGSG